MGRMRGIASLSMLISMVVVAVVLGSLIGTVTDNTIGQNESTTNVTGATHTMLGLVPLFLVIAVVVSFVKFGR